jgi:hypothetical protein
VQRNPQNLRLQANSLPAAFFSITCLLKQGVCGDESRTAFAPVCAREAMDVSKGALVHGEAGTLLEWLGRSS